MIILISGKKRSGKDYVANLLHTKIENSKVVAFADKMKEILSITMNITVDELNDYKNKNKGIYIHSGFMEFERKTDFRKLLQNFGTDAMQKVFGKNIWTDLVLKQYADNPLIISDLRFKHEYENLKHLNPFTIYVEGGDSSDPHISEHDLDGFSFNFIINNKEKPDLTDQIDFAINQINNFYKENK